MTSAEYAQSVENLVQSALRGRNLSRDEYRLAAAYEHLAHGAAERCRGIGMDRYEVAPDRQRWEEHTVADHIAQAVEEALDIPAYFQQIAYHAGLEGDADILSGVDLCAQILVILDRIAMRING